MTSESQFKQTLVDEERDAQLRSFLRSAHISRYLDHHLDLWEFCVLDTAVAGHVSTEIISYMNQLKNFWQPHCGGLAVPEEWGRLNLLSIVEDASQSHLWLQTSRWLDLSLLSAALSSIRGDLSLVPTADYIVRVQSENYWGPQFPLADPPNSPDSTVRALLDLLVCDGSPTDAFLSMASCFLATAGCQLKINPQIIFPIQLGDCPDVGFACAPEWTSTSDDMLRRSRKAPIRLSSPALAIGLLLEDSGTAAGVTSDELKRLAYAAQPHLEALLIAWHRRYPDLPPDSSVCIFAVALRGVHVFIVAHIPYLCDSGYRYRSVVIDQLPFPLYKPGANNREGLLARLRLAISLLTIQSHVSRVASLYQEVVWPPAIFDQELALVHECSGILTPSPSAESGESDIWGGSDNFSFSDEEEIADIDTSAHEIAHSKELVNNWLRHDEEGYITIE
ncbi:hypothetical protein B0H12DRAFT_1328706 [Mycena haematopus]|nr:hypothetical protein B0H12DRAFT_1328706 [Mycena haematopus]